MEDEITKVLDRENLSEDFEWEVIHTEEGAHLTLIPEKLLNLGDEKTRQLSRDLSSIEGITRVMISIAP